MDYYEAQRERFRNVPGLSIADSDFMDRWVDKARADDRHRVESWVRQQREKNKAKAAEVLERLDRLQDQFVKVRKQAERNEVPWQELAKVQRRYVQERITLEKVLESLEASEASSTRMESDPTAYLSEFYTRFPSLNDHRPDLGSDLAADRAKRGVAALL